MAQEAVISKFPNPFPRPKGYSGIWSWITTVDHKRIGTMYGMTAFMFFLVGGIEALIMRLQLARADNDLVSPEVFNQLFTMHGTTMIFLVVMPLSAAFFNWMIPLLIGARDVAFPRLNAFSYWTFLAGGLLMNLGFAFNSAPNAGWFGYANLTDSAYSLGNNTDFWVIGLQVLGIASLAAAFNFLVTIINMRAPGMSFMKMPVFVWMALIVQILLVLAFPVITVALIELQFDRLYQTNFFNPDAGGEPVYWQHMFWLFGHPEVYILILPAMGIVSEVLPVFSRKPLFGYPFVVFAGASIAFMGFFVWSHHMFTTGLGPAATSAFALSTMAIAVPTGIKIFNWIGTVWGGQVRLNSAMLFSLAFVALFIVGGLSGVTHASPPTDAQQQDTYYIVAHFHYVLFGGSLFGLFSGVYYWWPKITGKYLSEKLGKVHFWLMFIGMNLTFFPMHWLGLDGMPRRIFTYSADSGWERTNEWVTVGAFIIALSIVVFIVNFFKTSRSGEVAGADPWDARTLEWSIPSPVPVYNFVNIPQVETLDDWWAKKYPETVAHEESHDSDTEQVAPAGAEDLQPLVPKVSPEERLGEDHGIHLPDGSYYPLIAGFGLAFFGGSLMSAWWLTLIAGLVMFYGTLGWIFEPVNDPEDHH